MPSADVPSDPPAGHPADLQRPLDESVPADSPAADSPAADAPADPPLAALRPAVPDPEKGCPAPVVPRTGEPSWDTPDDDAAPDRTPAADAEAAVGAGVAAVGAGVAAHAAPPGRLVGAVLILARVVLAPGRALRRLLVRLRRAVVAWSRRPSGRLVLPGLLIAALVGAAGAGGGLLVPAMGAVGGPGPDPAATEPPPTGPSGLPVAPTGAPPVAPTAGPGLVDQPGARAEALQDWAEDMSAHTGIPAIAVQAYGYAELVVARTAPRCQLSWTTLAAIGRVESNHGRSGGATLQPDGRALPPIIGAPLDGVGGRELIPDTDRGALDGDNEYDRAVGPMQFIPQTWRQEAVDATGDGVADVHNINDAALASANYLCRHGRDLTTPNGWWTAVLAYNDVQSYAEAVFAAANEYGQRSRT